MEWIFLTSKMDTVVLHVYLDSISYELIDESPTYTVRKAVRLHTVLMSIIKKNTIIFLLAFRCL